jgi:hypothetical protein
MFILLLCAAQAQDLRVASSSLTTRTKQEQFLLAASIVSERRTTGRPHAWQVTLDDGKDRHDAAVETEDGTTPSQRNYRFNAAAYELDKVLELRLLAPSVVRIVNGRPASLTWWVDDVAMTERDRRQGKIEPPDAEGWTQQIQAVRTFDELTGNRYRNIGSEPRPSSTSAEGPSRSDDWNELLITRDWRVWLIDHTATFRAGPRLEHPESLTRCDRALLGKLRALNKDVLRQRLVTYLSAEQLDSLESRRRLLITHFDAQIARNGSGVVLYDLPSRR